MAQAWIVRAGKDDEYEHEALEHGVVALGWRRIGDLTEHRTLAAINSLVDAAYAEYTVRSRRQYGVQLFAFRCRVRVGDFVVLLRGNAPDVAVGTVTGDYAHRPDLPAHHVKPVRWARTDVRRTEIGADLLTAPALTSIYKIGKSDAQARLAAVVAAGRDAVGGGQPQTRVEAARPPATVQPSPTTAIDNLRRNLEYALSLATAGLHLQKLKVEAFEVSDVFRAAWVQAVAALDHWVHQEIHDRMLVLAEASPSARTKQFQGFHLPIALTEQVAAGAMSLREAVDQHFLETFGFKTFQQPDKIRAGLAHVCDIGPLWPRVANVLTENTAENDSYTAEKVEARLKAIVARRNKIAHEYDEDPTNRPHKRTIDAAGATRTVEWIGQLTEAIAVVLDGTR